MPLIVTGTIGIDTVHAPGGSREGVLGGSCTYFAAAASFYGPVRLVGAVGDDFPRQHRETLTGFANVDLAGLETRSGSKTFRWGGRYHDNVDRRDTLFTELGVLAERPPAIPEAFRDSQYVFLANTHPAVQLGMLDQLPNRRLTVADTMDLWIRESRRELLSLMMRIDGLVLNYDEAELLTGLKNTVAAARHILELGPKFVVVKKGEHGCILAHADGIGALPAYPSENVVDPTGAGDSFAGGMMGHIAFEGQRSRHAGPTTFETIREALAHGTVVASFTIETFGLDRLASLSPEEFDARLDAYVRMLRVR